MAKRRGERWGMAPEWLEMPLVKEWGYRALRTSTAISFHRNAGYEITFAAEGEVVWEVEDGRRLRLPGGHVCVTRPETFHRGEGEVFAPGTVFWLVIDPTARGAGRHTPFSRNDLAAIDRRLRQHGDAVTRAHPDLPPLFETLRRTFAAIREGSKDPFLLPWTQTLVCQITLATVRSFLTDAAPSFPPAVKRAMAFLEGNMERSVSVGEAARHVDLGESRFHEVFRQATGQTPADWLNRRRCAHAREALATGNRSVTEIALDCGFSSSQYFARCFRKYAGLSPTQYRKRFRKHCMAISKAP